MSSITCIHILPRGIYAHIALGTNAKCILVVPYQVCAYMSATHPPILIALSLNHHSDCMASVSGKFSLQSYLSSCTLQGLSENLPFFPTGQKRVFAEHFPCLRCQTPTLQSSENIPDTQPWEAELRERIITGEPDAQTNPKGMGRTKWK